MSSWTEAAPQARLVTWLAWRPEWPAVVGVAWAWAWLALVTSGEHGGAGDPSAHAGHHGGGTLSMTDEAASAAPGMTMTMWCVMCVAMMLPLALPALRHVATNSMPGHRLAGMAVCTVGFLAPWALFGGAVLLLVDAAPADATGSGTMVVIVLAVAAVWQLTPPKRWAVLSCSRTVPLAPYGRRAVTTRLVFGLRQSFRCMAACWPVMALMVVIPHGTLGLLGMAALTAMMLSEAWSRRRRRLIPLFAAPLALAATATAVGLVAL